ncbi:hypothetical protein LTR15_007676 [Elasticomyces elasticus]|nr:hypothetical protein LTR15_007676 [Elasticomyces elasticus]
MPHDRALQAARSQCEPPRPSTELVMAAAAPTLLTIPAEMRNNIYELVFGTQPAEANLLDPTPPSKALLLGCREIYDEAKGLYSTAYKSYWAQTRFRIQDIPVFTRLSIRLTKDELEAVNHLQFTTTRRQFHECFGGWWLECLRLAPAGPDHKNNLISYARRANGRWVCTSQTNPGPSGLRPRVLLIPQRGQMDFEGLNAEDLATLQSTPQETQRSAHRRIIEKAELDFLLGCELKLAEVDDTQCFVRNRDEVQT